MNRIPTVICLRNILVWLFSCLIGLLPCLLLGSETADAATATAISVASSQNPAVFGEPVTLNATVFPSPNGGTVAFKDGGTLVTGCTAQPISSGHATCTLASLSGNGHAITAEYSGNVTYTASASALLMQGVFVRPAVEAGPYHTCGVKADGALGCWGAGTTIGTVFELGQSIVPTPNADWVQVSAGGRHTCGLKTDGSIQCWGDNTDGGTNVPSPNANWVQVSAGGYHNSCGVKADGSIQCWGYNGFGQKDVPSPNANWVQVSAGDSHTCGVKADNTLQCWGNNDWNQAPASVAGTNWKQVGAGSLHTCGVKTDDTLQCWGDIENGKLTVPTPNTNWAQVSVGEEHNCGVKTDGALHCWGLTSSYDGLSTSDGPNANWVQVSASGYRSCAVKADGSLRCVGSNIYGEAPGIRVAPDTLLNAKLGATYTDPIMALIEKGLTPPYTYTMIAGDVPGLTLNADGTWSGAPTTMGTFNVTVQVRDANNLSNTHNYTLTVDNVDRLLPQFDLGGEHTCILKTDGVIKCWGAGQTINPVEGAGKTEYGQSMVPSPNANWTQVATGYWDTCGRKTDGTLQCWGAGKKNYGYLPFWGQSIVPEPNTNWVQVDTGGDYHGGQTCGLKTDGTLQCWGAGETYRVNPQTPYWGQSIVPEPNANWTKVGTGGGHTCGLKTDGTLQCWGYNLDGSLPPPTPNANWAQISTGGGHTCGLKTDGALQCWGQDFYGETQEPNSYPHWKQVSAGGGHTCALLADRTLRCWGYNGSGYFNDGGQTIVPAPNMDWERVIAGLGLPYTH